MARENPVLDRYGEITNRYHSQALQYAGARTPSPISDRHGFFVAQHAGSLMSQHSGVDKLFHTLVSGVVEDPDFAVKKDSRIYKRMQRDPQIYYCAKVRKTAVSSLEWNIIPPKDYSTNPTAIEAAEAAYKRIEQVPRFHELIDNIMDALLPGLSVNELVWKVDDAHGMYVIGDHFPVNKDRVKFDKKGNLRLLQPKDPTRGLIVPKHKYLTHRFDVSDGSWQWPQDIGYRYYGRGLADTPLYHYFYFKVTALRYLLKALERCGLPFKVFYAGRGDAKMADRLDQIMTNLQNDSVVGIPAKADEAKVDVIKTPTGASNFMAFIEYIDKLITRSILLQELMTEMPAVGSYAAARVHQSVFARVSAQDRRAVEETLNSTLMKWDSSLNTPQLPEEFRPRFKFREPVTPDTIGFLRTVESAINMGLEISEDQVREATGLRKPGVNERPLGPQRLMEIKAMGAQIAGATGTDGGEGDAGGAGGEQKPASSDGSGSTSSKAPTG